MKRAETRRNEMSVEREKVKLVCEPNNNNYYCCYYTYKYTDNDNRNASTSSSWELQQIPSLSPQPQLRTQESALQCDLHAPSRALDHADLHW